MLQKNQQKLKKQYIQEEENWVFYFEQYNKCFWL